ncbi:hypothetical protein CbuD7D7780_09305 [Coxiella burnetii]|nr:hypothetical protein CbuD7D7780_09305 [Coxiella burnetii]
MALLTPIYFCLSHYLTVFPHEYGHSLVASLFGFKQHFWQIHYGGTDFWNILFLINIDENVNYAAMHAANKDWLVALTAFAGMGIGNGLTYAISLWCMAKASIQSRWWLFYFFFWWNVNSIGNFIDYVPSRTFALHGDMANLARGLHISPWWIMFILGYGVVGIVWYFYSKTLLKTHAMLVLRHQLTQALLLLIVTLILFGLYGTIGLYHYGALSHFISLLLLWVIIPIMIFNWPWRSWVVNQER